MSSDEGYPTPTSEEQHEVEMEVLREFGRVLNSPDFDPEVSLKLHREIHVEFLARGLREPLRPSFISLEASRPWILYWILHSLDLLGQRDLILKEFSGPCISVLQQCQHASGGFGGGSHQLPHLATTYAAVSALICIGTDEALCVIDRVKVKDFVLSMKDKSSGGFRMHEDGEIDMRGTYCAIAVASILQLLDESITENVGDYVRNCQTYEGGIAGEPGLEAHGGYSYCGLAAVAILGQSVPEFIDIPSLCEWLGRRQMVYEGGFQGRANKLVDSCYTFWQGAAFPLISEIARNNMPRMEGYDKCLLVSHPAQLYVLLAAQSETGGMRDKPGKAADFYHTCYALSGLAALQFPDNIMEQVLGPKSNKLERNCVFYNNCLAQVKKAREFFSHTDRLGYEGLGVLASYPDR